MCLAGNRQDEQVWSVDVVGGAGDDYCRSFLSPHLIGEWKRYEYNFAKLINGIGGHLEKYRELQRVVYRVVFVVPGGGETGGSGL